MNQCYDPEAIKNQSFNDVPSFYVSSKQIWHVNDGWFAMMYTVVQFVLGVLTCIGNTLVITAVVSNKERTEHMCTKASLAIADLLIGAALVIGGLVEFMQPCQPPRFSKGIELVQMMAWIPLQMTSSLHLTFMSVSRCNAISRPFHYHAMGPGRKHFLSLMMTWMVSIAMSVAVIAIVVELHSKSDAILEEAHTPLVSILVSIVCWIIPYCITMITTVCMYLTYKRQSGRMRDAIPHATAVLRRQDEAHVTKVILFIVAGYSLTNMPTFVVFVQSMVAQSSGRFCPPERCHYTVMRNLHGTLQYSSSFINVIVYSAMDQLFRDHVKAVIFTLTFCFAKPETTVKDGRSVKQKPTFVIG